MLAQPKPQLIIARNRATSARLATEMPPAEVSPTLTAHSVCPRRRALPPLALALTPTPPPPSPCPGANPAPTLALAPTPTLPLALALTPTLASRAARRRATAI